MYRYALPIAICCVLAVSPATANQQVDNAKRVFAEVGSDPEKLGTYCAMLDAMYAMNGNEADPERRAGYEKAYDSLITTLGPEFRSAWEAGDSLAGDATGAKEYRVASEELEARCRTTASP